MNAMTTLHAMGKRKKMNDNEILKYLLQCLEATTKEEKEKIFQEAGKNS